jgi:hypothetical protein
VSSRTRFGIVGAVIVLFAVVGAYLVFGNQGPAPQQRLFQLTVRGTSMSPSDVQANEGDTLTVSISADRFEEIHLHGYDKHFFPSPGQPATVTFVADKSGTFVIEIEATSQSVGRLDVQPRSSLFGIGKSADQSSTTVHAAGAGNYIKIGSTQTYNLVTQIGPLQAMYTPPQAAAQHPKSGELMFSGQMTMPPGMDPSHMDMANMPGIPPEWRHLEVHIFDKKSGDVVKILSPVLTVTSKSTGQVQLIPNVAMQGIVEGPGDYHYGNNVDLPAGSYTVTVSLGSETANFDFNVQ